MTHLKQVMLEELQRRNYAKTTASCYVRAVEQFAKHLPYVPSSATMENLTGSVMAAPEF